MRLPYHNQPGRWTRLPPLLQSPPRLSMRTAGGTTPPEIASPARRPPTNNRWVFLIERTLNFRGFADYGLDNTVELCYTGVIVIRRLEWQTLS